MRLAIVGTGGVGGHFGGRIAGSGGDVVFVARGDHGAAIRTNGLTIRSELGDAHLSSVNVVESIADLDCADLIVAAVKLRDTAQVARDIVPLARNGAAVVSLQNGVSKDEILGSALPDGALSGGVCYIASTIDEPGVIRHSGQTQRIVVGEFGGAQSEGVSSFVEMCKKAHIQIEATDDIEKMIWEKLIFLIGLSAITCAVRQPVVRSNDA